MKHLFIAMHVIRNGVDQLSDKYSISSKTITLSDASGLLMAAIQKISLWSILLNININKMKRLVLFFAFAAMSLMAFGQGSIQNWQIEWADTSDTGGSVYRFMTTDTTTGVRTFVTRDFFAEILYQDSVSQIYSALTEETDTIYDAAYNQLVNGDTISNQFPNEIEVNIVRAINNDSIVLFLDTLSYNDNPDYVLGFHNVAVTDTVIRGTIKLIPKDSVSTLDIGLSVQDQTQNQIIEANQKVSETANKRSGWAIFLALVSVVFSIGYTIIYRK